MRSARAVLLAVLLAALAWPVPLAPACASAAPPPSSCCCPPAEDGRDGCGPRGCCCVRDGGPAEPQRPEPATAAVSPHSEVVPCPPPVAVAIPPAADGPGAADEPPGLEAGPAPARYLVLCTFRC